MQAGLQRADLDTRNRMNFIEFVALRVVHQQHGPLLDRQHRERSTEGTYVKRAARFGLRCRVFHRLIGIRSLPDHAKPPPFELAPVVDEAVVENPRQPGTRGAHRGKLLAALTGPDQRLLDEILGVGPRTGQPKRESIEPLDLGSNEAVEIVPRHSGRVPGKRFGYDDAGVVGGPRRIEALTEMQGVIGLVALTLIAWTLSEDRAAIRWRVPVVGFLLQFVIALVMLKLPQSRILFGWLNDGVVALQSATQAGTGFVFGYLGGAPLPFSESGPGSSLVLAFGSLPLIIVISALTALLTYWKILPLVVSAFSTVLTRSFSVSGAVGLAAAANIFVGMVEAPLFIRSWIKQLDRSELFMIMATGMATIAGTVFFIYTSLLEPVLDDAVGHLLTASIISAPAAILFAWLMIPMRVSVTGPTDVRIEDRDVTGAMDAITRGTERGMALFLNILAMLIVLLALVQMANALLTLVPDVAGEPLSLQRIFGWIFAPLAWAIGVPWDEARTAGSLLGIKTVLNEFIAFSALAELAASGFSERSTLIMSYALCGMANLGSLGIMIGGFTALMPERRREVTELGMRSIVAGTLATCSTGAVVGLIT